MSKFDDILKALEQNDPLEEEQSDQGWSFRRGWENAREFTTEIPEIDTRGVPPDEGPWEDSWGKRLARAFTGLEDVASAGAKSVGALIQGRAAKEDELLNDVIRDIYEKSGREVPDLPSSNEVPRTVGKGFSLLGDYLQNRAHSPEREKAFNPNNRWKGTDLVDIITQGKLGDYLTDTDAGFLYETPYNIGDIAGFLLPTKGIRGTAAIDTAGKLLNPARSLLGKLGFETAGDVIGSKTAKEMLGTGIQFGATMGPYGAMVNAGTMVDELKNQGKSDAEIADAISGLFAEELPADIAFAALTGNVIKGKLGNAIAPRGSSLTRKILANAAGIPLEMAGGYGSNVNQMILSEKYSGQPYGELFGEHTEAEKEAGRMGAMAGLPFAIYGGGRGVVDARAADAAYERFQKELAEGAPLREAALRDLPEISRQAYADAQNEYESTTGINAFMRAISGQESDGNYDLTNSDSGAAGAFQIMPDNWATWAQDAGLSPDAPMTPENQDRVARNKMLEYYNKFGNWRDVAIAWYAGEGAVGYSEEAKNRPQYSNGNEYPSINAYADSVMSRFQNAGGEESGGDGRIGKPGYMGEGGKGENTYWVRNGNVNLDKAQPGLLDAIDMLGKKVYDDTGVQLVVTSGNDGGSHADGEHSHYNGWKVDIADAGANGVPIDADGVLFTKDFMPTEYCQELIAYGRKLGLGMNLEAVGTSNVHLDVALDGTQWQGSLGDAGGFNPRNADDRPTIQQRADELVDQRFRERVSPQRQEQPQPPEPMQARQIDFKATDDETKSVFDGFAKEQANKAIADGDGDTALFFLDMFNGDEFQNTPENRAAIAERYGDELTQFAQAFTPTLSQATEQAQPVSVSAPRPQAQPAAGGTANKYIRNNDVIQAGNNFLEELRAKGTQADMATTVRLQAAISNGDTATVESILKANNRPVAVQQPQQPQQPQQQTDPVKQNQTPENVLTQQPQQQQQESAQPQQPAKPKKQPKTAEEKAHSYLAKPIQSTKKVKTRRRAGNAVIFLADNNGIEIPDADRKSLEHGNTKVINQWRETLISQGILSPQATQSTPKKSSPAQPSQPQQQAQPANKPLTLQDRMQQVVNEATEAARQNWEDIKQDYQQRGALARMPQSANINRALASRPSAGTFSRRTDARRDVQEMRDLDTIPAWRGRTREDNLALRRQARDNFRQMREARATNMINSLPETEVPAQTGIKDVQNTEDTVNVNRSLAEIQAREQQARKAQEAQRQQEQAERARLDSYTRDDTQPEIGAERGTRNPETELYHVESPQEIAVREQQAREARRAQARQDIAYSDAESRVEIGAVRGERNPETESYRVETPQEINAREQRAQEARQARARQDVAYSDTESHPEVGAVQGRETPETEPYHVETPQEIRAREQRGREAEQEQQRRTDSYARDDAQEGDGAVQGRNDIEAEPYHVQTQEEIAAEQERVRTEQTQRNVSYSDGESHQEVESKQGGNVSSKATTPKQQQKKPLTDEQLKEMLAKIKNAAYQSMEGDANTDIIDFVDDADLTPPHKGLKTFSEKLGVPLRFFRNPDGKFHGSFSNGVLFLNVNSKKGLGGVFWHESFHWLKANNPQLYAKLVDAAGITDAQRTEFLDRTGRKDVKTNEEIDEEILADQMDDVAKRTGLLQSIAGKNRGVVERVVQWLKDTMNKFIETFRNPTGRLTTKQAQALANEFGRIARQLKDENGDQIFRVNNRTGDIEVVEGHKARELSREEIEAAAKSPNAKYSVSDTIKNFASTMFNGKPQSKNHKQFIVDKLDELTRYKTYFNTNAKDEADVVIDSFQKIIRARHAYDFEKLLPAAGEPIAKVLGLTPSDKLSDCIANWMMTGVLTSSQEATAFQKAMRAHPAEAELLQSIRDTFQEMANMSAEEAVESNIVRDKKSKTFREWLGEKFSKEEWVDDLHPIKRAYDQMLAKAPPAVADIIKENIDPYMSASLFRGKGAITDMMIGDKKEVTAEDIDVVRRVLQHEFPNVDFSNFKPLAAIAKMVDYDVEGLERYALAKLDKEMHEKKNSGDPKYADLTPSYTEVQCDEIIKAGKAKYDAAQRALVDYSNTLAAIQYSTGVISVNQFLQRVNGWKNYVPTDRVFEEYEDISVDKSDSSKHKTGSKRRVYAPLGKLEDNTNLFIRQALQNRARLEIVTMARLGNFGDIVAETPKGYPQGHTIHFKENGKMKYLVTPDESLKRAVESIQTPADANIVVQAFKTAGMVMRGLYTMFNAEFAAGNPFRDLADAFIHNKYGSRNPFVAIPAMVSAAVSGFAQSVGAQIKSEEFRTFLAEGGAQSGFSYEITEGASKRVNSFGKKSLAKSTWDKFIMIAEASENMTRFSTFKTAKDNLAKQHGGVATPHDLKLAAMQARRATVDFARAGRTMRGVNKVALFSNAAMQSLALWGEKINAFRKGKEGAGKELFAAVFKTVMSGVMPALALAALNFSDDDRRKRFEQRPTWEKDTYWIFGDGLRVPKGMDLGIKLTSALTEEFAMWLASNKPVEWKRIVNNIGRGLPSITTTIFTPAVESYMNYSIFKDAPIVPYGQQDDPKYKQYGKNTGWFAKWLGKTFNESPRQIDHLIAGYGGSMFTAVTGGSDGIPIVRRFLFDPDKNPRIVQDYYKALEEQEEMFAEYKARRADGEKVELPEDYDRGLHARLKNSREAMRRISKAEMRIMDDPKLDADKREKKLRELEKRRVALCERVLGKAR